MKNRNDLLDEDKNYSCHFDDDNVIAKPARINHTVKTIISASLELLFFFLIFGLAIILAVNFSLKDSKSGIILWSLLCGWMGNMIYLLVMKLVKEWLRDK